MVGGSSPELQAVRDGQPPKFSQSTAIRFDRYSLEEGLSQSTVLSVLQDSRGFLWAGTADGLNRFDGYGFRVYRHDPGDPYSLSNNYVSSMCNDPDGALWIGTYGGGLNRFDPQTGRFEHYRADPSNAQSLSDDQILTLYQDQEGALWIGTRGGGLNRFDPDAGTWQHFRNDPDDPFSLSNDAVMSILQDSSGVLWVGTARGLDRLNPAGQWDHYRYMPTDPGSLSNNSVQYIYEDSAGRLWIGTAGGGLNRLDREAGAFVHYQHNPADPRSLVDNTVQSIAEDLWGGLWIGTDGGLDRLDEQGRQFVHYENDPTDPYSLSDEMIRAIYQDRAGGLWIGTFGGGLNRYDWEREQFTLYRANPFRVDSLSASGVWCIYEDASGVLWIGTDGGGLDRFERETGQWRHFRNNPSDPYSLSDDSVTTIYQDRSGSFWLGTFGGGLERFDPQTERFIHYRYVPDDPQSLSSNIVWSIHEDPDGALWIATSFGLNRFDRETETFTRYYHDPNDPKSLSDNNIGVIYQDRTGVLWIATHYGLNRFDPDSEQFSHYLNDPNDPDSLSHNIVFCIHEDRAGTLWFGTWGGGLNRFDRESETFTAYRAKDGLANDTVYGILEDDQGNLWLSTNYGISKFDPQMDTFENYDARDGLQSNEFNYNAYYRSPSGEMFFGGLDGFNAFYPDQIKHSPYVPPVVLTSLTQGGEVVDLEHSPEAMTEAKLRWPRNDFEFQFAALSYYRSSENQYAYMLEGYDSDWQQTGTRRFGAYTNLPGGSYTLRVIGSSHDGIWNEEGVSLSLTIVPPFWATWWFRSLAVLALAATAVVGYRLRVRSVEMQRLHLQEQVANRTRELAALNKVATVASQSLDLQQILNDVLNKTLEVTGLEAGGIYLLQDGMPEQEGVLTIAAYRGLSTEFVAGIDNLLVGEGFSGRVVERGKPLVVENLAIDPRLTRSVVKESGFRSLAIAPVVSRARVLGSLFVMARGHRQFTPQEIDLLTAIGAQIGVAIENARFFEEEQRRAEQFRVIAEVGRRIALTLDIDEVLGQIAKLIQESFGYYHVGIGLVEGDELVYRVGAGPLWEDPDFDFKPARLRVGKEGISGWVVASGRSLLVPDVSREPRYVWMRESKTRSELTVPVTIKGKVIGVLDAQSDRLNAFDDTDLTVLEALAHQAGTAIENAQLYEQAQEAAVIAERSRLARDLHDAVTQTLFSASLIAEALPASWELDPEDGRELLRELRQLTRGAMAEMRTLLLELRPAALADSNMEDLLHQLAEATTGRAGTPVEVIVEGECKLTPDVNVAFYRIAQEALNNVVKHSRASQVTVCLRCPPARTPPAEDEAFELCVIDNGRGFVPEEVSPEHLGLDIMRERAQAIGAQLEVSSQAGKGTEIRVVWKEN